MEDRERLVRIQVRRFYNTGVDEDDLFQEGMLALLRAEKTFDDQKGVKFETYASHVIYNRLIDILRKHQAHYEEEPLPLDTAVGEPLGDEIERRRKLRLVRKVLAGCTDIERAIFNAYYQGYSYKEICGIFDVTTKKIDNTIQKIKKRVQSYNED